MNVSINEIIKKYYSPNSKAGRILISHSEAVAKKALEIAENAKHLNPNKRFIREASMLHDVGIFLVHSPDIGCYGEDPYVRHGVLGKNLLEEEGCKDYALVCERHLIISEKEIIENKLPLPERDMIPVSVEEEIITLADKFFSKGAERDVFYERSVEEAKEVMGRFGEIKTRNFDYLLKKYNLIQK